MSIEKRPGKWVKVVLLAPIRAFIQSRSKVVIERNDTAEMKGPYIILGNHVTNWDPFIINSYVNEPICFIAGETLFRHRFLKGLLEWTGAIPKMKFKNDTRTIRSIIKAKKHHRVIGIFPEGNRNWDGTTEPIIYSTAMLVKMLNIPVVIATIRGGYLSHPRWAETHRKGTMAISLEKKWDVGDLSKSTPEEIHQLLTDALAYNEMEWQREKHNTYKGKNLAEYLERLLFICPQCEKSGHLHSEKDIFQCQHCDYTIRYSPLGTLEQVNEPIHFQTTYEWNQWQLDYLKNNLLDTTKHQDWKETMQDYVQLYTSDADSKFTAVSKGKLIWDPSHPEDLLFQMDNGEKQQFSVLDMEGINIHLHHDLDFFVADKLYRFQFFQPRTSAYKWLKALQHIQETSAQRKAVKT